MNTQPMPNWAEELVTLLPACAHFLLSGNVGDNYFLEGAAVPTTDTRLAQPPESLVMPLPALISAVLRSHGIGLICSYEITEGMSVSPKSTEDAVQRSL